MYYIKITAEFAREQVNTWIMLNHVEKVEVISTEACIYLASGSKYFIKEKEQIAKFVKEWESYLDNSL